MPDNSDAPNSTVASSPSSTTNQNADGLKAAKDRKCPFCSQAFTSSSLGRHLDLYIKPKNPKPPDGVHDVEEIKKIRGNITRRQPRTSLKAASTHREGSGTPSHVGSANRPPQFARAETEHSHRFTESTPVASPVEGKDPRQLHGLSINAASWESTGVINDIPPRASPRGNGHTGFSGQAQRIQEMRRDTSTGQRIQRPDYEADTTYKSLHEQAEIGRAAEMALREVLGSVQAARRKVTPNQMYPDIDFFALPFPSLCLAILPAPPTLESPAPFPSADSWTLDPPDRKQYEVVNRLIQERGRALRAADPDSITEATWFRTTAHLQGAFQNWQLMSPADKATAWNLSILRAFSSTQTRAQNLAAELEALKQHTSHLEAQYDRLSRCQLPREFLSRPPSTLPLSSPVLHELRRQTTQNTPHSPVLEADYDADALLTKWREVVRSVSRPPRPPRPSPQTPTYAESITRGSRPGANQNKHTANQTLQADIIGNGAVWAVNGPIPMGMDSFGVDGPGSTDPCGRPLVSYETPPEPGTVVEEEEAEREGWRGDEGWRQPGVDVATVLDASLTGFVDRNALAKQRRFVHGNGNVNGEKRTSEGAGFGDGRARKRGRECTE